MKKNLISIILMMICSITFSQTLKVNENKYVSIVFDGNIIQGALGNRDFVFDYNPDGTENVGLIKAIKKDAKETNLIVKTSKGNLYNLNIIYGSDDNNIVRISQNEGVNLDDFKNTTPTNVTGKTTAVAIENNVKNSVRENDYIIGDLVINDAENSKIPCDFCEKVLKVGKNVKRINSNNYNIKLDLQNVAYSNGKIYISINVINNSAIDYNINYIKSYVKQSKEEKSSNQYLEKNPTLIYNSKHVIKGYEERKMIFVYDQFTIDKNKFLVFELNEANGERNQALSIPNYIINNPLNLN